MWADDDARDRLIDRNPQYDCITFATIFAPSASFGFADLASRSRGNGNAINRESEDGNWMRSRIDRHFSAFVPLFHGKKQGNRTSDLQREGKRGGIQLQSWMLELPRWS
jgi:hypothetical protein